MVLGVKVVNARFLREAVQAVLVAGSGLVTIIWCPEFLGVQSVFPVTMPEGENPTTLIKIAPQSFSSYDSLDDQFNAIIKIAALIFLNSHFILYALYMFDHILLNSILEFCAETRYGILPRADFMNFYIPMKIYGILPEGVLSCTDISHDLSAIPLTPVATFRANDFAQCMATLKNSGFKVLVNALEKEVLFFKQGRPFNPLRVMNHLNGLISTREDCKIRPIQLFIHMQNLEFMPAAVLSDEVSLFKRSKKAVMIWFKLAFLKGDIIQCLN